MAEGPGEAPASPTQRGVIALRTLDCAHKLRIHYQLPRALDLALAEALWPGRVQVQAFSQKVAGARDLVEVRERVVHASGAVGGLRLVVTYGKLGADAAPQARASLEAAMTAAGLGPVVEPKKAA